MLRMGIDVGSTTLKFVVVDEENNILHSDYQRHFSQISQKLQEMTAGVAEKFKGEEIGICMSGSAGMGICEDLGVPFVQEVFATRLAVKTLMPETDVVIELGGEDAKILFVSGATEIRMNGSCAGGTGAFIDQMATLLQITPSEMNRLAQKHEKIYTIASRCGVFAKSDIQPLLNQGASKEDISASIFMAVVNQTISGLAQGRKIEGNVLYLGGPLTFFSELRNSFDKMLKLSGFFPENSLYFVALGSAFSKESASFTLELLIDKLKNHKTVRAVNSCKPLFENEAEYEKFAKRHNIGKQIETKPLCSDAYIGIDAGSTTLKGVVISENEEIAYYKYMENGGSPLPIVKEFLTEVYEKFPDIKIKGFATTGYGEEIVKEAFGGDFGVVETIAHFTAAKKYNKNVDFIIDIGGQDIKCFKIRNSAIDNIFLNEACSSGCGSFLQTFATALGENIADFADKGLMARNPVDLGSRCTVFMNSSVKQAQKDGAKVEDIAAGLCISVVKNALYKVIRVTDSSQLGENVVVQGGTFLNNSVLRAFEQILEREVTRPEIAGLMGAYGCALYAKSKSGDIQKSKIISKEELANFTHEAKQIVCGGCTNHCKLTVNTFPSGRKFIAGNRCDVPLGAKSKPHGENMFDYKRQLLESYKNCNGKRGTIGIPMVLNMYEMLPFWHTLFTNLGFGVRNSGFSTHDTYLSGQQTIPSDTVCYPAKLVHGHIENLLEKGVSTIFYPCLSYNFNEGKGDNHYNCPVVAYYPEVIEANVTAVSCVNFINDYIGVHERKHFPKKFHKILEKNFGKIPFAEVKKACDMAYLEHENHLAKLKEKGKNLLAFAKENGKNVIVLCGRPYHLDPEINHGIDKLTSENDTIVLTEESVCDIANPNSLDVLNQWTYHARLYAAANYVANEKDININLVQMVSFGCGLDAITTDEVRRILEEKGKIYTQVKIDEITNLGAVKIRLRSLLAVSGVEK
ncbi:MAG: acyl-CoA dehydratase activase [Bacillota bacterium]